MKKLLTFLFLANCPILMAQTTVFDRDHLFIVNDNAFMRNVSEMGYQESLDGIRQNTDDIGLNTTTLAMVEKLILKSLNEVNEGLKNAIQVKQIGRTLQRIYVLSDETLVMSSQNPVLLLFAETYIKQAKERSLTLITEVSTFVLSEGENLLINGNVRDELLVKIRQEIELIAAYLLAVRNAMYWANINGVLKQLNPYQTYINQNLNLADQILRQKRILQ
ncbi:hypothetical protein [Lunatibacter salilacus]|uniref:hypothetical protein n=1 Tax=Lunatibacter salilacus TaxID=2483804 RepID=UPI00131ADB32|nr:hypothetical protein [Lunatibacter salilacus]